MGAIYFLLLNDLNSLIPWVIATHFFLIARSAGVFIRED